MRYLILTLLIFSSYICLGQKDTTVWDVKLEEIHLNNRQDSSTWDLEILQSDTEAGKELVTKPIKYGAFPVPRYELLGQKSFKGVGTQGNLEGIDFNGKKLVYISFSVNKNTFNQRYIDNKNDEVFFTIVMLTDFIDTVNYTHTGRQMISRNNPDFIGQGFFKTLNDEIDFIAFLTAERNEYAIVNMRLFNLKMGRVILIAPQKDGSLRSMQIKSPLLEKNELDDFIDKMLKNESISHFFNDANNI